MTPLLLLLLLPPPGLGAGGRDPRGVAEPVAALEALLSSGSGSLPHGAVETLVGIAAGRAQCHAGPCGKCPSAGAVLALAGKAGAGARLEATELPWLGAAIVATLRDPPSACAAGATGRWAARARALHRAFAAGAADAAADAAAAAGATGGPGLREVGELLAAVQPNYRSAGSHEACVDAAAVLAAGAAASPRVGAGRVLAALGALVLRGRCLRPPVAPGLGLGLGPQGLRARMQGPGPGPPALPPGAWDAPCPPPPELLQLGPDPHPPALPRHGPTATGPTATSPTATGATATSPTATGPSPAATDQLSIAERYALGTAAGLAVALCPLLALALLRCPLCHRARRWLQPLLLGLAAGALSGDALLHLLPQSLGLHDHAEGCQPPSGGSPPPSGGSPPHAAGPPWPLLGALGGLLAFFLLERLGGLLLPPGEEGKMEDADPNQSSQQPQNRGRRALRWALPLGRGAHALADGVALGAAFGASWRSGAAAALGLLCHELPHALGSASALAQGGLGGRWVLGLGLAGALPLLPGLYAGLALAAAAAAARAWLGALAAGLLLHLALCDMVPAMLSAQDQRPWLLLGLQSAGLLGGWGLLLLLALYEDSILR